MFVDKILLLLFLLLYKVHTNGTNGIPLVILCFGFSPEALKKEKARQLQRSNSNSPTSVRSPPPLLFEKVFCLVIDEVVVEKVPFPI